MLHAVTGTEKIPRERVLEPSVAPNPIPSTVTTVPIGPLSGEIELMVGMPGDGGGGGGEIDGGGGDIGGGGGDAGGGDAGGGEGGNGGDPEVIINGTAPLCIPFSVTIRSGEPDA